MQTQSCSNKTVINNIVLTLLNCVPCKLGTCDYIGAPPTSAWHDGDVVWQDSGPESLLTRKGRETKTITRQHGQYQRRYLITRSTIFQVKEVLITSKLEIFFNSFINYDNLLIITINQADIWKSKKSAILKNCQRVDFEGVPLVFYQSESNIF